MIVFTGGHASGFRNIHDYDSYDVDGTRLFHVRRIILSKLLTWNRNGIKFTLTGSRICC